MGRVGLRLKKNISSSLASGEELMENKDPSKCKRINSRRLKENVAIGHQKNNLPQSTNKENNSRSVLTDKTNSTLNVLSSERRNILTENNGNSLKNETKLRKSTRNIKKSLVFTEPTQNHESKNCTVVNSEISENTLSNKEKHVIPIYKQNKNASPLCQNKRQTLQVEEKLAMYEFDEVDDSEEPTIVKKKRKKRNYKRKKIFQIGPKYLTVNNIKFSSSESINSLTDKPLRRKPCKPAAIRQKVVTTVKRVSQSMINLNDTTNTCVSVASFKSQPALQTSYTNTNCHADLSVIHENELSRISQYEVLNSESFINAENINYTPCTSEHQNISSFQNLHNTTYLLEQINKTNSEEVCSSTPCKIKPCPSEKFDKGEDVVSGDEFHGFEDNLCDSEQFQSDCDFGFDEDERLEEPLLSPIKNPDDKCPDVVPYVVSSRVELPPVLSVREIVQLLQAEQEPEETTSSVIEESTNFPLSEEVSTTLNSLDDNDVGSSFAKPPRRSYQRQSSHRYTFVEKEHESSGDEEYIVKPSKPHPKRKPTIKGKKEVEYCGLQMLYTVIPPFQCQDNHPIPMFTHSWMFLFYYSLQC